MTDENQKVGLGKVIYSVTAENNEPKPDEEIHDQAEVREADEESFPASDPPSFAGGTATETT